MLNKCRGWVEILNKHQATDFKQKKSQIWAVTQATDMGNSKSNKYGKRFTSWIREMFYVTDMGNCSWRDEKNCDDF